MDKREGDVQRRSGLLLVCALAPCVLQIASCSVLVDRRSDQCASSADCAAKGGAFAGTACVEGVCVPAQCQTTPECLANPETPNTYCGADLRCRPILSEDCKTISTHDGKPISPDAIVLGVLAPLSGDNATDGQGRVKAAQLAMKEIQDFSVGIPTGPGTKTRPLALVICDQIVDATRAATHLAAEIKVPAILGPGFSGTTIKVAKNVTIPNGTLLMSPSATSPDLTVLDDSGLVWRTSSSFAPEAVAFAALVSQMESSAFVRAALGLAATDKLKLAILAKGDSYGKGLAELLASTLQFNGTDVAGNGANFRRFDFPDLSADPQADTTAIVQSLVDFQPDFVVVLGTAEVIVRGIVPIEDKWPTAGGSPARPFYLISEGAKLNELPLAAAESETAHAERKLTERIRVIGPAYNDALYSALSNRYQGLFNEPMPDVYGLTGSYDGFYLLTYALYATQTQPLSGATIALGLRKTVPPAALVKAGPSDLSKGIAEISAGKNIDYDGVTGQLDFDVDAGEALGNYRVFCVSPGGFTPSGQDFDSSTLTLVGPLIPCP